MEILKIGDRRIIPKVKAGEVFVYPTDTVYGLGCNALIRRQVLKVRKIKRTEHPFSVIATKKWIKRNLEIKFPEHLDKLPGPYTLIFRYKENPLPKEVSFSETLGVRIPAHPIAKLVERASVPVITTSCNISGRKTITRLGELPGEIADNVDFAIDGGVIEGKPSQVWDLTGDRPVLIRS